MKRIILAASLFLTSTSLWAGSLTISAPSGSVGGSSPQWQYNQSGTAAGVAPVSLNVAAITLTSTHTIVLASATATGSTYTLPAASNTGQILQITKVDASTQPITILTAGTDVIAGSTKTLTLNAIGQTDEITAGPGGWWPHGQGLQITPYALSANQTAGTGFTVAAASDIVTCPFTLTTPVALTGWRYDIYNINSATIAFGLLDKNGNVLASTGPVAMAGSLQTLTMNPINVPPGSYYMAIQMSNTGASIGGSTADVVLCGKTTEGAMGIVNVARPGGVFTSKTPLFVGIIAGGMQSE